MQECRERVPVWLGLSTQTDNGFSRVLLCTLAPVCLRWPVGQRHPQVKADTTHNYASTWISHAQTT